MPAPVPAPAPNPVPDAARQLVLVTTPAWDANTGRLARYARDAAGAWQPVGTEVPVTIGKTGLAWGRGLHGDGAPAGREGPIKAEGDRRSPAGVFRLGGAFGIPASAPTGTRVPYQRLTRSWRCVDDPDSPRYNQLFDAAGIAQDWRSAEEMLAMGELYRWVVVVDHNSPAPRAGAGSCVFLHVWRGPESPTVGCTAMADRDLADLIAWLTPDATVLVALPENERADLRAAWGLP